MQKPTVLVVDDEAGIRRALVYALQQNEGYDVIEAADGIEAQDLLRSRAVDVVITDLVMPRLDGFGLLAWAQEHCPGPAWLILSGMGTFDGAVKALQLGAFDFVTKPLSSIEALETSVRNALTQKRLEAESDRLRRELEASNAALRHHVANLEHAFGLLREQGRTIEQDLRRAERIQRALLPRSAPAVTGLSAEALYRPSHLVGGDLYGIERLADGRVAVYVADSAGHGVSAAMLSVLLKQRIALSAGGAARRPSEVLASLNNDLFPECSASGLFVTVAYALVDPKRLTAVVASAGHTPMLHIRPNGDFTPIERTGPGLGLTLNASYDERVIELGEGDRLLLYTDGLTYEKADGGALERRLAEEVSRADEPPEAGTLRGLVDRIWRDRDGVPAGDDVTLLLVRIGDTPAHSHIDNGDRLPARPGGCNGSTSVLAAGTSGEVTWIAVKGAGTWVHCASLHDVCTDALSDGRGLILDFGECTYLDSTFLGTVHHVACAAGSRADRVTLVHVPDVVRGLFEELAMHQVLARIAPDAPPPPALMTPLAESRGARSRELILHGHELLASLSAENERQFGEVVRALRSQAGPG
jgi:serine phosphatase RsbU (regulator of sigma subunit)/anti-anti-sigma regulatory factor